MICKRQSSEHVSAKQPGQEVDPKTGLPIKTANMQKMFDAWTKSISADSKISLAEFNRPIVPYISGIWSLTYEYNEMAGRYDNKEENPCTGPFPYRYTWNVYIWQRVENVDGKRRTTGDLRVCWCLHACMPVCFSVDTECVRACSSGSTT